MLRPRARRAQVLGESRESRSGLREVAEPWVLDAEVVGRIEGDGNGVVAGVEVDAGVVEQELIAVSGEGKEAAERGNGSGGEPGELGDLVAIGKAQAAGAEPLAGLFAVEPEVGREYEHEELVVDFADQGFGARGERGTTNFGGLGAREHGWVTEQVERDSGGREAVDQLLGDGGKRHGWFGWQGRRAEFGSGAGWDFFSREWAAGRAIGAGSLQWFGEGLCSRFGLSQPIAWVAVEEQPGSKRPRDGGWNTYCHNISS